MYLKRVIDEHPHTPWALLAEYELSTEMGWEWKEGRMFIASTRGNGNDPDRILLAEEQRRQRMMRKKKQAMREPPKL